MEQYDLPLPPHYFREFTTPTALPPPDIKRMATVNPEFCALGAKETFADHGEKITPVYVDNKPYLLQQLGYKADLTGMIELLHEQMRAYIKAIGTNPDLLEKIRKDMDATIHNLYYLMKIIRVKIEARVSLRKIYQREVELREERRNESAKKLSELLVDRVD